MRSSKINYAVVGTFVLLMLAGLVVSLAVLTGRTGATDSYHVYYGNVTGVKFGTQVVYEGYPIGQVEAVTPEPSEGRMRFRVDFAVNEGWRIPKDSFVRIAAPGLLAAVTLTITAGASPEALKPGAELTAVEGADLFSVVSGVAEKFGQLTEESLEPLIGKVGRAVDNINRMLEGEADILVKDMMLAVQDASELVADMSERIPSILEDMKAASREVRGMVTPANRKLVEDTLGNMNGAAKDAQEMMAASKKLLTSLDGMVTPENSDVRRSVKEVRYIVESISRHIDSINENMEGMSRNMLEFSRQIRKSPGLLLSSQPIEDEAVGGAAK